MKFVKIGVIGAGRIGQVHAQNIARQVRGAKLAAVADLNLAAARTVAEDCGGASITQDYQTILDDPEIDAVVICSSTDTHAQIIEQAANRHKQIFCEKPIDLTLLRIEQALACVQRAEVKLQVGFNRRFDPSFAAARQQVANGKIGKVHLVRITSRDPAPPPLKYVRASGGIFLDMTIHDFDMARFLTGSEVVEVFAAGATLINRKIAALGDADTCVTTLRMENESLVTIDNSRQAVYGYDQRIEIFGSSGMIAVGNQRNHRTRFDLPENQLGSRPFFIERYSDALLAEMQSFVNAVREDREPAVTGLDGLAAALAGFAAIQSAREHRSVRLSEICRCRTCRAVTVLH